MHLERELKRFVRQIRPGLIGATANPNINLLKLIEELRRAPQLCTEIQHELAKIFATRDIVGALTETGLVLEAGLFNELFKRLEYKLLPRRQEYGSALSFFAQFLDSQSDPAWLEKIDREILTEFLLLILPDEKAIERPVIGQIFRSLEILSLRLAGLGFDPVVSQRLRQQKGFQQAFIDVSRFVHQLVDGSNEEALSELKKSLHVCNEAMDWIRSRRSTDGASLALTYRMMKINQAVGRMQNVVRILECMVGEWDMQPALDLFFEILLAEIQHFDLRRFFVGNIELVAFQITEHTGRAGEHYITRTRTEWAQMFKSAALGGVIVAILVILKVLASKLHLAVIPEGFVYGLIYAVGFLFINAVGGVLATKQPAMTASKLAQSMDSARNSHEALKGLSEEIIRTIRSQLVALLGNYLVAFPVAALICFPLAYYHHPLMNSGKAMTMISSLHPFLSLSFWYAAIAGVCLFISGLLAGFADNWFVFNHVGLRLRGSEVLRRWVGDAGLDRTISKIEHNLGFWVGNVSLGFFLSYMGVLGTVLGLPLDVRHITFSSGSFGAALASLNFEAPGGLIATIAVSVFIMGLINLAVSFSLSLFVAIKSRRISFDQTPDLLSILGSKFLQKPTQFFIPPRSIELIEAKSSHHS